MDIFSTSAVLIEHFFVALNCQLIVGQTNRKGIENNKTSDELHNEFMKKNIEFHMVLCKGQCLPSNLNVSNGNL